MTLQPVCGACKKNGSQSFSRCGHILHKECFERLDINNECPTCEIFLSWSIKTEELFVNIKSSDLHVSDAAELCIVLENLTDGVFREYMKSGSYNRNILENLQKLGFDINSRYYYTDSWIFNACYGDYLDKVNLLIDNGLGLDEFGVKGLEYACLSSSYDVIERLIQAGIQFNGKALNSLVSMRNFELLERAFRLGADVNMKGYEGQRPIHAAARSGSIKMLQYLIENGAEFNAVDEKGNSILHCACIFADEPKMVKYLIESGFDPEIQNNNMETPFTMAVKYSNISVVEYLIQAKANINVRDKDGNTLLHNAVLRAQLNIIEILIRAGVDLNAKNNEGKTPLHVVRCNEENIVKLLLENGADINILDKYGKNPFYYLHLKIGSDLKMQFINKGTDLTIKSSFKHTILDLLLDLQ